MCVWARASTRRYKHVNHCKFSIGLFTWDNDAVGVANYGKEFSVGVLYLSYVAFHIF